MKCPRCAQETPARAKFCLECGMHLGAVSVTPDSSHSDREGNDDVRQALAEAVDQQTATAEILHVISSSPNDVQPVFDAIVRNAVDLCHGNFGAVYRYDASLLHLVAHHNIVGEALEHLRQRSP